MKLLLLFISAICLSTTGISQRAEAQNYPWCAYYGGYDSHVKRLRKKFKASDGEFDMIETLYGVGYRFKEL